MICPNCGEDVPTKHTFCVVCGAEFSQKKTEKETLAMKRQRLKEKIQGIKSAPQEKETVPTEAEKKSNPSADETAIIPDFMRNYI